MAFHPAGTGDRLAVGGGGERGDVGWPAGAASWPWPLPLSYARVGIADRLFARPLPGTYACGRALGTLAPQGTRLGEWLASRRKGSASREKPRSLSSRS